MIKNCPSNFASSWLQSTGRNFAITLPRLTEIASSSLLPRSKRNLQLRPIDRHFPEMASSPLFLRIKCSGAHNISEEEKDEAVDFAKKNEASGGEENSVKENINISCSCCDIVINFILDGWSCGAFCNNNNTQIALHDSPGHSKWSTREQRRSLRMLTRYQKHNVLPSRRLFCFAWFSSHIIRFVISGKRRERADKKKNAKIPIIH